MSDTLPEEMDQLEREIRKRMAELEGVTVDVKPGCFGMTEAINFTVGENNLFGLIVLKGTTNDIDIQRVTYSALLLIDVIAFEPILLDSHTVSEKLKKLISRQKEIEGNKLVDLPLNNMDEVEEFLDLIRLKYEFYKFGGE